MRGLDFEMLPDTGHMGLGGTILLTIIIALAVYWIFIDSAISTYKEGKERKRKREEWEKKNKPPYV